MGAKISKRGSYNLDKPEKKSKKKKKTKLTQRAPSFISLSQAQIYEDAIKSPELSSNHKTSDDLFEKQSATAVTNKQINEETGEFRKVSSDHGIYSTSSDEELYQNVFGEDGINREEQLERKNTEPKVSLIQTQSDVSQVNEDEVQTQEVRKRKTWSKQAEDSEEPSVAEREASAQHIYSNTNWKEVLNGGFWKEEATALEKASQISRNKKDEEISPNSQLLPEAHAQIEILDEDQRMRDAETNEPNQTTLHAQLHNEHSHIIPADSIEKLRDMLQEQNSRASSTTPLQEIEEDEEDDVCEQVEIKNDVKPVPKERKRKVTFEDMKQRESPNETSTNTTETEWKDLSTSEEQMELPLDQSHKTLSKSISVNSDVFYELDNETWEDETESEDQELFYDAVEFEGEDFQVEVPNTTSTKSELQTSTSSKAKTTDFAVVEEQNLNEHEGLEVRPADVLTDSKNGQTNSFGDFNEDNVGILIEFDEDTSTSVKHNPSGGSDEPSKKRFSEQVEITDEFDNLLQEDRVNLTNSSIINPTEAELINSNHMHDPHQSTNEEKVDDFMILDESSLEEELKIREMRLLSENNYDEGIKGNPIVISGEDAESSSVKGHLIEEQLLLTEDTQLNTKNSVGDKENDNVRAQATTSSTVDDLYEDLPCEDKPIVAKSGDEYTRRNAFEDHKSNFNESTALTGTSLGKDGAEDRLYNDLLCEAPLTITASTEQEANAKIGSLNLNQIKPLNGPSKDDLSLQEFDKKMFTTGQKIDDDISLSSSSKLIDLNGDSFDVSKLAGLDNFEDTMSSSISKPTNLSFLMEPDWTLEEPKSEKLQKGEFKPPSTITTPEEIAEEQMRVWGEEKDKQVEEVLAEINKIMVAISDIKAQIDDFQPTETDSDQHSVMFQKLIKIMSEVNRVDNHNFNQSILDLQSTALNEVHACIRVLQSKKAN